MAVSFLQASAVTEQGNGLPDIQPGLGLGFPSTGDDLILLIVCTSGAVGYELENEGWNELILHQFDAGVDLAFGMWWVQYDDYPGRPTIDVDAWSQKTEFCQMMYFTGVSPDDPIGEVGTVGYGPDDSVIGPIPGLDAPADAGGGIVCFGIRRDGHSSDIDTLSGDVAWEEVTDNARLGLGDASLAMALDLGVDDVGGTTVADKTFTQTGGDDANWLGVMFTINPLVIVPSAQGWPRGDIALAPSVGDVGQGWPRGASPNYATPEPPPDMDDRQIAILDTEPVAYWPLRTDFTEFVGGAAPDLTPHGSPSFVGGAVDLDGSSQYMLAEDFNPYDGASILTFLVFIARDGTGSYQAILGSYISSYDFYFNSGTSQLVCGDNGSGSQKFLSNSEDYIGGSVQPLFIEISDTGDVVNVWSGTTPDGSNGFAIDFTTVAEPDFAIGLDIGISNTGAGSYFPGLVSDVAIWDRALSGGERTAIVAATL